MDRLTFALVAIAVVLLAVLPFFAPAAGAEATGEEAGPSLREALAEDHRTGKITADEYDEAMREEGP